MSTGPTRRRGVAAAVDDAADGVTTDRAPDVGSASSARTTSLASAGRSAGLLARQRATSATSAAGSSARIVSRPGAGSIMCARISSNGDALAKGKRPASSSKAITPHA